MSTAFPATVALRTVAPGRGSAWIGEAFGLFRKSPGVWIGLLLVWLLLSCAIGALPVLGVAAPFLNPVFNAGVMLGCASLARGEGLRIEHLFAGFRSGRLGPLLMLTVWTLLLLVAAVVVAALLAVLSSFEALRSLPAHPLVAEVLAAIGLLHLALFFLLIVAVMLLVAMATWFAVPLIVFRGVTAAHALRLSFRGCLANWLPLTVYGLLLAAIFVLPCLPLLLGLLMALPLAVILPVACLPLFLLIAVPVALASVYLSYRDIYPDSAA